MTKAEKTRAFIIEKSAPIFNMKGFAGTSMADLTEATGLTKGAIYGNFQNKDEVALAVYDYNLSFITEGLAVVMRENKHTIEKLKAMAGFYRCQYKNVVTRGGCPVLNTAVESDDNHALLKRKVAATLLSWMETVKQIIETGKQRGEVKPDADGAAFGAIFVSLIEGGIMLSRTTDNSAMLDYCIQQIDRVIDTELAI